MFGLLIIHSFLLLMSQSMFGCKNIITITYSTIFVTFPISDITLLRKVFKQFMFVTLFNVMNKPETN